MRDPLDIAFDQLRTMMGATAAEPYVRAIQKAVTAATSPAAQDTDVIDAMADAMLRVSTAIEQSRRVDIDRRGNVITITIAEQ